MWYLPTMAADTPYLLSIDHLLDEDERLVWSNAADFTRRRLMPIIEKHYEEATFPKEMIPEFGEMGFLWSDRSRATAAPA